MDKVNLEWEGKKYIVDLDDDTLLKTTYELYLAIKKCEASESQQNASILANKLLFDLNQLFIDNNVLPKMGW